MNTNVYDFMLSTEEVWAEVDVLIELAEKFEDNGNAYNAICRSATVLILSHLEGFIKALFVCIVRDLNSNLSFSSLPKAIRKTYCKHLIGGDDVKNSDARILNLMKELERLDGDLAVDTFDVKKNANPKPKVISKMCERFGVCDPFVMLHQSRLEDIFSMTESESVAELKGLRTDIAVAIKDFPYNLVLDKYGLSSGGKNKTSFWQSFIDEINRKRHQIAHGSTFENHSSARSLKADKIKIEYFQCALIALVCGKISDGLVAV